MDVDAALEGRRDVVDGVRPRPERPRQMTEDAVLRRLLVPIAGGSMSDRGTCAATSITVGIVAVRRMGRRREPPTTAATGDRSGSRADARAEPRHVGHTSERVTPVSRGGSAAREVRLRLSRDAHRRGVPQRRAEAQSRPCGRALRPKRGHWRNIFLPASRAATRADRVHLTPSRLRPAQRTGDRGDGAVARTSDSRRWSRAVRRRPRPTATHRQVSLAFSLAHLLLNIRRGGQRSAAAHEDDADAASSACGSPPCLLELPAGYFTAIAAGQNRSDLDAVLHLAITLQFANGVFGDGGYPAGARPGGEAATLADYRCDPPPQRSRSPGRAPQHPFIAVWKTMDRRQHLGRRGAQSPERKARGRRVTGGRLSRRQGWLPVRGRRRGIQLYRSSATGHGRHVMLDQRSLRDRQLQARMTAMKDARAAARREAEAGCRRAQGGEEAGTRWSVIGQQPCRRSPPPVRSVRNWDGSPPPAGGADFLSREQVGDVRLTAT